MMSDHNHQIVWKDVWSSWMCITSRAQESFETKLSHLLKLLRTSMKLDIAIVSRIEKSRYEIYAIDAPGATLRRGARFDLSMTYCEHTLKKSYVTSFHHASQDQLWQRHPAYEAFTLEAYIGCAIHADDLCFGTLNLSSTHPRDTSFSTEEHNLIAWTAQWIGRELAHLHKTERFQHEILLLKQSVASARDHAMNANAFQQRLMKRLVQEMQMPLKGIASLSMQLSSTPQLDTLSGQHRLQSIHTNSTHLLDVLSQVFKNTTPQHTTHTPRAECFSLYTVLEEVATLLAPMAYQKGLYLDICLGAMLPDDICSDPVRMRQILMNLLSDSIQRTSQGGIFVRCSLDNWQPTDEQACLCIDIQDTSEEGLALMLQDQDSLAAPSPHSSIGVEIAGNLIQMLNGQIKHQYHGPHCFERHITLPIKLTAASVVSMPEDHRLSTWISCEHMPLYQSLEMSCARYGARIVDRVDDAQLCLVDAAQPNLDEVLETLREQAPLAKVYLLVEPFTPLDMSHHGLDGTLDKPLRQSQLVDLFMQAAPPRHMPNPMTTTLSMELSMDDMELGEWLLPPSFDELNVSFQASSRPRHAQPHTTIGVPASSVAHTETTPELESHDPPQNLPVVDEEIYEEFTSTLEDLSLFQEITKDFFMQGARFLSTTRQLNESEEIDAHLHERINQLHKTSYTLGLPRVSKQCEQIHKAMCRKQPNLHAIKNMVMTLGDDLNEAFELTQSMFKSVRKAS